MLVIKRNGDYVSFDREKVKGAILKAMNTMNMVDEITADRISRFVENEIKEETCISIEEIQDMVEVALMRSNYKEVAKHYVIYREDQKRIRETQQDRYLKLVETVKRTMSLKDIENSNANVDEASFSGKNNKVNSYLMKEYALEYLLLKPVADAHKKGKLYTHDLDNYASGMHNCVGRETRFITSKGVKSFYDFIDGDEIVVLTHTGEWKKAIVKSYGEQTLNKITLKKGSRTFKTVRATNDHRWLLKDGTFTTDLKAGDVLYSAPAISSFDFDNASENEKSYWRKGFAKGDGVVDNNWNRHKNITEPTNRTKIRLCGSKMQFLPRFENNNECKVCDEKINNGDKIIKLYNYSKELPNVDACTLNELQAFIDGLYCADGNKGKQKGIQFTGQELVDFVRDYFEVSGYYITSSKDKTNQITNFGQRSDTTVEYRLTTKEGKFNYKVDKIESHTKESVWCLEVEDNHTFVLSGGIVTGNCLFIDFEDLFNNKGFCTRNGDVRKPNDIMTFFQLVAVVFQCQSQFGFAQ